MHVQGGVHMSRTRDWVMYTWDVQGWLDIRHVPMSKSNPLNIEGVTGEGEVGVHWRYCVQME